MKSIRAYALPCVQICLALGIFVFAIAYRTALLTVMRPWLVWSIPLAGWTLVVWLKKCHLFLYRFTLGLTCVSLGIFGWQEVRFRLAQWNVLHADVQSLTNVGQHFILGHRDFAETKQLVESNAIAGIYISQRYLRQSSLEELRQEIRTLQAIRREKHGEPLLVMTDQEGGIVSHLSPPLTKLPPLAQIVDGASVETIGLREAEIRTYARIHGQELQDLGITMNLAPVVDLQREASVNFDQFSLIHRRAISRNPQVVAQVAQWYCEELANFAITCTLKHFPGLARVEQDTHFFSGRVRASVEELTKEDWVPFRHLMTLEGLHPAVMMSHTYVDAIDPHVPASLSGRVMSELMRRQWKYHGYIITDDFSMFPISLRFGGVGKASVEALDHGADLILISYDTDLYYEAMAYVLNKRSKP